MHTIIGSSERDFVLIILFQIYGFKTGLYENNLFWVGQYDLPPFILEEVLTQYWHNLIQFSSNLFKITPCQNTANIVS